MSSHSHHLDRDRDRGSRSRSPSSRHHKHRSSHRRSRSPTDDSSSRRHHRSHRSSRHRGPRKSPSPPPVTNVLLPCNAKALDYPTDLQSYFRMFAKYLDIQKQIDITTLDEYEVKSRFKKFVGRWNLGELAAGWYEKDMKVQADEDDSFPTFQDYRQYREQHAYEESKLSSKKRRKSTSKERERESSRDGRKNDRDSAERERRDEERVRRLNDDAIDRALSRLGGKKSLVEQDVKDAEMQDADKDDSDDSDDMIGPALPDNIAATRSKATAKPPTTQDLILQREMDEESLLAERNDLRYERAKHNKLEKDRLEELVPRAEPGTRERKLEKKREANASNRAFADAKGTNDVEEMGEGTLLGGDDSFRQRKAAMERKKNERELRKEGLLKARKEEREQRLQVHRQKEEQTMKMLRALADKFR